MTEWQRVRPLQQVEMFREVTRKASPKGPITYISLFEKIFLELLGNILNQINQVYLNCHQSG